MAARRERGPVRGPGREAWRCCTRRDARAARRGLAVAAAATAASGAGAAAPSRAPRRWARLLPVAERAQPPAMLRALWPRGLNLAAPGSPAGPGDDGECWARGLGQGRAGDFQKPELETVSRGSQPARSGQVARSERLVTL